MCSVDGCNNKPNASKNYCHSCKHKRYKKRHPIKSTYNTLKNNAKRRNKKFTITLDWFTEFCRVTDYINKKGIYKESLHIDRIDETLGYVPDNLQVITNSENIKKYVQWLYRDNQGINHFKYITHKYQDNEDCPF